MKEFFDRIGSSFFIAALIPSLGFLILMGVTLEPIIPPSIKQRFQSTFEPLNQSGLLLIIGAIVLGFTLSSLGDFINRIFQGDYLLERLPFKKNKHQKKARALLDKIDELKNEIKSLDEQLNKQENEHNKCLFEEFDRLRAEHYTACSIYQRLYPPIEQIRPTRFGNIIQATDYYTIDRYGIDRTAMWGRLIHAIPESYYNKIDQSGNSLAFILNCAVLSFGASFAFGFSSLYQLGMMWLSNMGYNQLLYFIPIILHASNIYLQRSFIYIVLCLLSVIVFRAFYYAATQVATQYGNMVRGAFDLYRLELLSQLKLTIPKKSSEEYDQWQKISEFIQIGRFGSPFEVPLDDFEYQISSDSNQKKSVLSLVERLLRLVD